MGKFSYRTKSIFLTVTQFLEKNSAKCIVQFTFLKPLPKSKVLRWLMEAETEPRRQDRKTRGRNVCTAVPRRRPVLILKGTVSAKCLLVGPAWRRV